MWSDLKNICALDTINSSHIKQVTAYDWNAFRELIQAWRWSCYWSMVLNDSLLHFRPCGYHFVCYHSNNLPTSTRPILCSGGLLAERCRINDLLPHIPISCLLPWYEYIVWTTKFRGWTSSSTVLSRVVLGRPMGLLQSVGGCSAVAMTQWWSSSGVKLANKE